MATVSKAKAVKSTVAGPKTFGWEGAAFDPLTYDARKIVDEFWPDTPTPDVVAGLWDNTPIMQCVITALRIGIEKGKAEK